MTSVTLSLSVPAISLATPEQKNQLRKLAQLIGEIYTMLSEMSQKDRQDIVNIKARYHFSVLSSADSMQKQGNVEILTASASLITFIFSITIDNKIDQQTLQLISDKGIAAIGRLCSSHHQAQGHIQSGISQIELQDLQDKSTRSQSEGNTKSEIAAVLQAETARHRAASAPSGG